MNKLKLIIGGIFMALMAWLKISAEKSKADAAEARADLESAGAAGANAQLDQLEKAQTAARDAGVAAQEEVDNVKKNVKRGDFSGSDNTF